MTDHTTHALNALTAPRSTATMLTHTRTYRDALRAAYLTYPYNRTNPKWANVHAIAERISAIYDTETAQRIESIAVRYA